MESRGGRGGDGSGELCRGCADLSLTYIRRQREISRSVRGLEVWMSEDVAFAVVQYKRRAEAYFKHELNWRRRSAFAALR